MRKLIAVVVLLLTSVIAHGHGGGLDNCGGHNDRKKGGYHVHNDAKYCACYPDAPRCQKVADEIDRAITA